MDDKLLEILITVPLAIVGLILLKVITSCIKHGFRGLLVRTKAISLQEKRSYTQLIGVVIGKSIGRLFFRK